MAVEASQPLKIGIEAGADLSGNQYRFVKLSGTQVVACTALTDSPIGVLQNKPTAAGQMAEITIIGVTKLVADAALATIGSLIGTSAVGRADLKVVGDTGEFVLGRTLSTAAAAGEIITAVVSCVVPVDGAAAQ